MPFIILLLLLFLFLWQLIFIVIVKDFDYCLKEKEMLGSNLPPSMKFRFFFFVLVFFCFSRLLCCSMDINAANE